MADNATAPNLVPAAAAPEGRDGATAPHDTCTGAPPPPTRTARFYRRLVALPLVGPLVRFGCYWLGLSAFLASFAVCPCCGNPGCASGALGLGGAGAALLTLYRRLFHRQPRPDRTSHRSVRR